MSNKVEKAFLAASELRAESQGDEFCITGYAALFNNPSKNLGGFIEQIAPSAFDRALREKQLVRFTFNHSMDDVLARTDNATLQLSTDSKGLKFRAQLQKSIQRHSDLWNACKAGLYNECSFAFVVPPGGDKWSADGTTRTLLDVDLQDCALVGVPAYEGTSAAARSDDGAFVETHKAWLATQQADWKRQERAHEIGLTILRDANLVSEKRDMEDFASMRDKLQAEMCGYQYVGHDANNVYGVSEGDEDDDSLYRWSYELDGKGGVKLDNRVALKPEEVSSVRSAVEAVFADRELRARMRSASGISVR